MSEFMDSLLSCSWWRILCLCSWCTTCTSRTRPACNLYIMQHSHNATCTRHHMHIMHKTSTHLATCTSCNIHTMQHAHSTTCTSCTKLAQILQFEPHTTCTQCNVPIEMSTWYNMHTLHHALCSDRATHACNMHTTQHELFRSCTTCLTHTKQHAYCVTRAPCSVHNMLDAHQTTCVLCDASTMQCTQHASHVAHTQCYTCTKRSETKQ